MLIYLLNILLTKLQSIFDCGKAVFFIKKIGKAVLLWKGILAFCCVKGSFNYC